MLLLALVKTFDFELYTAFGAALLFTCHPVHVEAIANIVGRAEPLAATFSLLACMAYGKTIESDETIGGIVKGGGYLVLALVSGLLAFASKETGARHFNVMCNEELQHRNVQPNVAICNIQPNIATCKILI